MKADTLLIPQETEALISGCEAIAQACKLADVDVITGYPIRPYDTVMQAMAKLISNGEFDAEFIIAESEHSQFEMVKHASAVGARVFVGSSGVGWFYAMEALAVTAGLRMPVVAIVGNRALDDPGAFGVEHNDAMAVRDLGWMLTWVDTAQEALDTALMAWRLAEDRRVLLPVAIGMDGSYLTHSQVLVKVPSQEMVEQFLPPYNRGELQLHPDNPITIAPQVNEDWLIEIRKQSDDAMRRAKTIIPDVYADFQRIFGRGDSPFFEAYMMEDAEVALLGQGTIAMPIKVAIRRLRADGQKVGLIRLKWLRPFPTTELQAALANVKAVGVIDRDYSFGSPFHAGVLATELRSALYSQEKRPQVVSFIAGLGGRDVTAENVIEMSDITRQVASSGKSDTETHWIGVRG